MTLTTTLLITCLGLVFLDGLIELALAESRLWWIHSGAAGPYTLTNPSPSGLRTTTTPSRPAHLLFAPVRAASAAGALAFVIATAGFLSLWLRSTPRFRERTWARVWVRSWPYLSVAMALFTLAAAIALNALIDVHDHQSIDFALVAEVGPGVEYPLDSWTLPGFYAAVKGLVADGNRVRTIEAHLRTMMGWRWNLVPLLVLQVVLSVLAWVELAQWTRRERTERQVRKGDMEAVPEKGATG